MLTPKPIPTELDYNPGNTILPEGYFRISASKFSTFVDKPWQWYREVVLGEEGFTANTSSVIGTICHYCAEMKAQNKEPNIQEIENYIKNYSISRIYPDVDTTTVRDSWKQMAMTLVNEYVLPNKNNLEEVEPFVYKELQPGYFPSGSIDRVEKVGISPQRYRIVDYKTYNSKTKPTSIPMHYKYQLLIYAYIYSKPVSEIRLVYINRERDERYISSKTGKSCGKIYPPELVVLTEMVTQDDMNFIESLLNLCIDTHKLAVERPDLTYILYRDPRLKGK